MELRVLRYFLTVVHEENITKAAEILHITQPTLSRQIKELEEELGTQLFLRGKSKITLTQEGMLLRRRAEELIELADRTAREFDGQEKMIEGEICIGAAEAFSMHTLAKQMKCFSTEYPRIRYNLLSGNADDIKERIDKGLLDIGLLLEPVDIDKYEFLRLPIRERWGILMHQNSPLTEKEQIQPEDLINLPLLISKRFVVQNEIKNWYGSDYDKLNIIATYNLIYNAAIMVEEGLGNAITIDKLVSQNEDRRVCFRPFYPELLTGTVLVWKKHQVFSTATTRFIEYVKASLNQTQI